MKLKSLSQKDRYGNMFSVEFFEPDASIPMMMMIPDMANGYNGADTSNHPGDPKGTDTVPAWLTPGENVVNAEASRIPGNQEKIDEMNDEGRAIQEAQGGPIPSYAAGGMQIPRPDGMLNSLGNRLKEKDGGPMYAQGGRYIMPDFLSDEFLDNEIIPGIYAAETSSGANVRTSKDGAIGPMQILPSTAASPGYSVAPRTLSDIRSLEGSQQFAKDYLRGIHKENPDFTMDELITAYHSGAGNVRKAKNNVEPLGARGQKYAGKVGVTEPSLTDKITSVISSLNPISEAQAQTVPAVNAVPSVNAVPPVTSVPAGQGYEPMGSGFKPDPIMGTMMGQPVYSGEMGDYILDNNNQPVYLSQDQLKGMVSIMLKQEPIADQGGDSFGDPAYDELFAPPLPGGFSRMEGLSPETTDKYGVPKRKLPEGESIGKQGLRNKVIAADKDIETASKVLEKIQKQIEIEKASPEGVSAKTVQKGKAAVNDLENAKKTKEGVTQDINKLDAAEALVEEEKNADANEILKMNPATVPKADATPPSEKDAAQSVLDSIPNKGVVTPEIELEIQDFVESYYDGRQTPDSKFQETIDTAAGWFKDTFKSMFSGPEFARMIMTYAGSRVLGYDHGGSLQFSMKNYIDRIDANEKQYQKDIRGEDYQDFTQASRDKFEETRDYADLKKKKTKVGMESIVGQKYLAGVPLPNGKMFSGVANLVKLTDDTQAYELPNGTVIPISDKRVRGRASTLNPNLHDRIKVKENFLSALDREAKRVNRGIKDNDDDKTSKKLFITDALANQATNELFKAYDTYGADPRGQTALAQVMSKAMTKWADDSAKFLQTGEGLDVTGNLEAYFNRERIIDNYKISPKSLEGTNAKVAANLINQVARFSDDSETDAKRDWAESERIFNKALADKSIPKYGFDAEQPENSGYSKFTWWLSQIYAVEANEKAVQLLNNVIAKEKKGA